MPSSAVPSSVLIVDPSDDSREVLRTLLAKRGLQTLEAAGAAEGLEMARAHHPRVIVMDVESSAADSSVCIALRTESLKNEGALLLLSDSSRTIPTACRPGLISKPYHYAPLIRTIDEIIACTNPATPDRRAA